jgi:hypothetical protein
MKIIAHRGNLNGPNPNTENHYSYIQTAIDLGFDVEVDVWVLDNKIFFGHDSPQYAIEKASVASIGTYGWFHCKNLEALEYFKDNLPCRTTCEINCLPTPIAIELKVIATID